MSSPNIEIREDQGINNLDLFSFPEIQMNFDNIKTAHEFKQINPNKKYYSTTQFYNLRVYILV